MEYIEKKDYPNVVTELLEIEESPINQRALD